MKQKEMKQKGMKKKMKAGIKLCLSFMVITLILQMPIKVLGEQNKVTKSGIDVIECPVYDTGNPDENSNMPQYIIPISSQNNQSVIEMRVPSKGVMSCILFDTEEDPVVSSDISISISIYEDLNCTQLITKKECINYLGVYYETINITKGGTYYLKIKLTSNNGEESEKMNYCFMPTLISSANRELTSNTWSYSACFDSEAIYYRVETKASGYITVNTEDTEAFSSNNVKVALCDSNKKVISNAYTITNENNEAMYAINSGVYFLKVIASTTTKNKLFTDFRTKYNFTAMKDVSGKSKNEATAIKLGANAVVGTMAAQENTIDWYKIDIKNKTKVSITLDKTLMDGDFTITIVDSHNRKIAMNSNTICNQKSKYSVYTSSLELNKDTYYISVTKKNTTTSGYYSIKAK